MNKRNMTAAAIFAMVVALQVKAAPIYFLIEAANEWKGVKQSASKTEEKQSAKGQLDQFGELRVRDSRIEPGGELHVKDSRLKPGGQLDVLDSRLKPGGQLEVLDSRLQPGGQLDVKDSRLQPGGQLDVKDSRLQPGGQLDVKDSRLQPGGQIDAAKGDVSLDKMMESNAKKQEKKAMDKSSDVIQKSQDRMKLKRDISKRVESDDSRGEAKVKETEGHWGNSLDKRVETQETMSAKERAIANKRLEEAKKKAMVKGIRQSVKGTDGETPEVKGRVKALDKKLKAQDNIPDALRPGAAAEKKTN